MQGLKILLSLLESQQNQSDWWENELLLCYFVIINSYNYTEVGIKCFIICNFDWQNIHITITNDLIISNFCVGPFLFLKTYYNRHNKTETQTTLSSPSKLKNLGLVLFYCVLQWSVFYFLIWSRRIIVPYNFSHNT